MTAWTLAALGLATALRPMPNASAAMTRTINSTEIWGGKTMSTHTIRATITVRFIPVSLTEIEESNIVVDIEYGYLPGYPATGPTYASGGEPGCGAEVEFRSATLIENPDGLWHLMRASNVQREVDDRARKWLDDAGYNAACREAEDASGPDPDAWYDAKRSGDFDR